MQEKDFNIYVLPNKNPLHVIEVMKLYHMPIDLSNTKFFVFEGLITKKTGFIQGNYFSLTDLMIELEQFLSEIKAKNVRLVIENLSSMFIGIREERVFEFLKHLFIALRKKQVTALIEVQSDAHDARLMAKLESITDGSIQLKKEIDRRFLLVERLSDMPIKFKWLPFQASKGKGVKVIEFYK
jgi:KaiC/GvpD/RAD55 family RecA-like ATPase